MAVGLGVDFIGSMAPASVTDRLRTMIPLSSQTYLDNRTTSRTRGILVKEKELNDKLEPINL